jgi:hypothetical protein
MTGYQLHDSETEEILGSVIITHTQPKDEDGEEALRSAWEDYNKLEETDNDNTNVEEFVEWFNGGHVTQIERLFLDFIQH